MKKNPHWNFLCKFAECVHMKVDQCVKNLLTQFCKSIYRIQIDTVLTAFLYIQSLYVLTSCWFIDLIICSQLLCMKNNIILKLLIFFTSYILFWCRFKSEIRQIIDCKANSILLLVEYDFGNCGFFPPQSGGGWGRGQGRCKIGFTVHYSSL